MQYEKLSKRELEVLKLLALGMMDKEISNVLHICLSTVETHGRNIRLKLGVQTRTEAVVKAIRLGIVNLADIQDLYVDQMTYA